MVKVILQDIDDRVPHRQRRRQLTQVIAIGENTSAPPESLIDPPRQPDPEAAETFRQRELPARLDDEMDVIRLNAEVSNAKARLPARVGVGDRPNGAPDDPGKREAPQ